MHRATNATLLVTCLAVLFVSCFLPYVLHGDRGRVVHVPCKIPGKKCWRAEFPGFLNPGQVRALRRIIESGLEVAKGGDGGPSILDMASGAVSHGTSFVNVYAALEKAGAEFRAEDISVFNDVKLSIQKQIIRIANMSNISLTAPTFFTRITPRAAVTVNDEYWHDHIDEEQYRDFAFTGLVYLNNHYKDFRGGRFSFLEADGTVCLEITVIGLSLQRTFITPTAGKLLLFTSGPENVHSVEKVTGGERYALTVAFRLT